MRLNRSENFFELSRTAGEFGIKLGPQIEGARIVRATELFGFGKAMEQSVEVFGEIQF